MDYLKELEERLPWTAVQKRWEWIQQPWHKKLNDQNLSIPDLVSLATQIEAVVKAEAMLMEWGRQRTGWMQHGQQVAEGCDWQGLMQWVAGLDQVCNEWVGVYEDTVEFHQPSPPCPTVHPAASPQDDTCATSGGGTSSGNEKLLAPNDTPGLSPAPPNGAPAHTPTNGVGGEAPESDSGGDQRTQSPPGSSDESTQSGLSGGPLEVQQMRAYCEAAAIIELCNFHHG